MGPPNTTKAEKGMKAKSLLRFAAFLSTRLQDANDTTVAFEIQNHINGLPLQPNSLGPNVQTELDRLGTELWNFSTRMRRDSSAEINAEVLCLVRVFSFFLLDSAQGSITPRIDRNVRLMKVALKAAKYCLEHKSIVLALKMLERAAEYERQIESADEGASEEQRVVGSRLRMEYFILRIMLAWKQDRLDLAEYMFPKACLKDGLRDPTLMESLSDLLFEIGKSMLRCEQYEMAVKWLERAYDTLEDQDIETLSGDASELRLSIMHGLVKAFLGMKTDDARIRAWDITTLLDADFSDKMIVSLLKLELLSEDPHSDHEQYFTVLQRMGRSIVLNDANFKTIMHHIHKLKSKSPELACKILDNLISSRLYSADNLGWIEKAIITHIWILSSLPETTTILESLSNLLDSVSENVKDQLPGPATHAAHTLLWKRIEKLYGENQYEAAESWCRLSTHRVFKNSGESNLSKFSRKTILCALARQDFGAAREAFFQMSDSGKDAPLTRYLMYKVAIKGGDTDLALECLDIVCRESSKDATLLYACVLEAQQSGDRRQAVVALQKVLEKYQYSAPQGVHLPALLRCTARLLMAELDFKDDAAFDTSEELCRLFEGAAKQANKPNNRVSSSGEGDFISLELEWFSRNIYNLALKFCTDFHPIHLARLLGSCVEFITLLQKDGSTDINLILRRMFCYFLRASAYITLARAEDEPANSIQHYTDARKQIRAYRNALPSLLASDDLNDPARDDLISKHFELVKFELESTLKLSDWDAMDELFDACWKYENPKQYDTLADLVLVVYHRIIEVSAGSSYQEKVLAVLQKIINLTWRANSDDVLTLSRWIRCLFQLALSFNESVSLQCLDQAKIIAEMRKDTNQPYPATELSWLVATAFNRAVDLYCASDEKNCRLWAEKALTVASLVDDGGVLHAEMEQKFSGLTWE
ncbi:SPO22-domain-containing protein [Patellaria atrata CBS 101060]|uniref:Protein ZIP4 homolog n=1 Tax=Patellaria atrata CBS 101060 TaxID=1346257 RepID=A0A9P4VTI6_9PEZI|nr:SPO22-domain-containing protein [Patellaria atrata CBS 101060]